MGICCFDCGTWSDGARIADRKFLLHDFNGFLDDGARNVRHAFNPLPRVTYKEKLESMGQNISLDPLKAQQVIGLLINQFTHLKTRSAQAQHIVDVFDQLAGACSRPALRTDFEMYVMRL